jgi:hypothetical protein
MKRHNSKLNSNQPQPDQTKVFMKQTSESGLNVRPPSCLASWTWWAAQGLAMVCLIAGWASDCLAQGGKMEVGKVMAEICRFAKQDGKTTAVMWFPQELWEASLQSVTNTTPGERQALIKLFEQYLVVGVCRFEVGPIGANKYDTEKEIGGHLLLTDGTGTSYRPLANDKISPDFQEVLTAMKPFMALNLGKLGKNFNLYVLPGKSNTGELFGKASGEGGFAIQVADSKFTWNLPLESILPQKSCARCGEKLSGAFKFCPYDATMLTQLSSN